jgi:heme exporter protein C
MNLKDIFTPAKARNIINKNMKLIFILMILSFLIGFGEALLFAPDDYLQGNAIKIMYVHVPAAWMSLGIYTIMAVCSGIYLIWNIVLANEIAKSSASIGAMFSFIALVTGSLWGKPIWGTWWVWDARLTSMLILFLFYLGYIVLNKSLKEYPTHKSPSILVIFGFVNVPIVKFSVDVWNTLHQPASILKLSGPAIHISMLRPLIFCISGCMLYYLYNMCLLLEAYFIEQKLLRLKNSRKI